MKLNAFKMLIMMFLLVSCITEGDKENALKNPDDTNLINTEDPKVTEEYTNLFNPENLHTIEVVFTQSEWDGVTQDMLDFSAKFNGDLKTGNYRKAHIIYNGINSPEGAFELNEVGFRTRGNTTRVLPEQNGELYRAHFKIKFNETFDMVEGSEDYKTRKDRRFYNLRELNLKKESDDTTLIREQFAYNFLNKQGVYAPKSSGAKLYITINGVKKYFGIYTVIESVDKSFLTRRYGKDRNDGNLYKCLWQGDGPATLSYSGISSQIGVKNWRINYRPSYDRQTNDEVKDYTDLINFAKNLNDLSGSSLKTYIDAHFAVDRFLKWIACNQLLGMPDDYWAMGNNYFLYFPNNPTTDKIEFIAYDYDHGLGRGWYGPGGKDSTVNANIYTWITDLGLNSPLSTKLLAIPEYKTKYETYLKEMTDPVSGDFTLAKYKAYYDNQNKVYQNYLTSLDTTDKNLVMQSDTVQEDFITNRVKSVRSQLGLSVTDIPDDPVTGLSSMTFSEGFETENNIVYAKVSIGSNFKITVTAPDDSTEVKLFIAVTSKDNQQNTEVKELTDNAAPFEFTFSYDYGYDWWDVKADVYTNTTLSGAISKKVYTYNGADYNSPVKNNDGSYTFYFKPNSEYYVFSDIDTVYLRGSFNSWGYSDKLTLTNGIYSVTKSDITQGQLYKFCIAGNNGDENWFRDRLNKYMQTDGDYNSILP